MTIVNIAVENDADFFRVFQYQTIAGMPINITGATFVMMLRRHAADVTAVLRLGTDTGEIITVDAINGAFSIFIAQQRLEQMGLGDFDHSNVMTMVNGIKRGIWTGTFTNKPGAAR
jgi:hypothetical protein